MHELFKESSDRSRELFQEISDKADKREEKHQSELCEMFKGFSEDNGRRERKFYTDLLAQQARTSVEINESNAKNMEFLKSLQEVTLSAIAMTIQGRSGINIKGDNSQTTPSPEPIDNESHKGLSPPPKRDPSSDPDKHTPSPSRSLPTSPTRPTERPPR